MPMVVKIVGSTPTIRTKDESEVVGVLDTEQNKQWQLGMEVSQANALPQLPTGMRFDSSLVTI